MFGSRDSKSWLFNRFLTLITNSVLSNLPHFMFGGLMTIRFKRSAQRRIRDLSARFDRLGRAPLTWLITGGLVLMLAIAVGTGLAIERFRQDAIESGRGGLESAVLLLARHFDRQFEDFSVLQKRSFRSWKATASIRRRRFAVRWAPLPCTKYCGQRPALWLTSLVPMSSIPTVC